ncbi:MAG: lipoyl(octanoyl) transferase LipB [Alphaproteobacteria bacterium]
MSNLPLTGAPAAQPREPGAVEWRCSPGLVPYLDTEAEMKARARAIADGAARELVWLLEHPPLYTAGTSAKDADLLEARFPVYRTGRGGEFTYHGPGQRIAYVLLDLKRRKPDVRAFVCGLENWIIGALAEFGVQGVRREGRIGVWIPSTGHDDKIAAIGIRLSRWVSYHGIALNVAPDLSHYAGIVPCGIRGHGVTSLEALGVTATMDEVDAALRRSFAREFA